MNQSITELEALKSRLKATWMSGDFDKIAQIIEPGAVAFIERLALTPARACWTSLAVRATCRSRPRALARS